MYLTRRMQQVIKRLRNGGFAWQDSRGMWCLPGEDKADDRDFCHSMTILRLIECRFAWITRQKAPELFYARLTEKGSALARVLGA